MNQQFFIGLLDRTAISTSVLCALHCLTLPLIIGVFPAIGVSLIGQEAFHQTLVWFVIPMSIVALSLGCWRHKDTAVILYGLGGLAVLIVVALLGHDLLGEAGERILTVFGGVILSLAHWRNFRLC